MKNAIIHWNCRGLRAYDDELQLLLDDYDPIVAYLPETKLKEQNNANFRYFNLINRFALGDWRGTGGNAIIIHNKCPSRQIHLTNKLHVIAKGVIERKAYAQFKIKPEPKSNKMI